MLPTIQEVEAAIEIPWIGWTHQCHAISLAIVRSGIVEGRVARGACLGVGAQHSWVVLGTDCYDRDTPILDPTLWSYRDEEPYIWRGTLSFGLHTPHGAGSIWQWGRPPNASGPVVELAVDPGEEGRQFLELLGPLDRHGWGVLAQAPVEGWPAAEILAAMDDTPGLSSLVPIDVLGMLTDRNPGRLYLRSA